jgi:uncharacterized membrane protein YgcG
MSEYKFHESSPTDKAVIGDVVSLQGERNQNLEVVECQETHVPMLNIDADDLAPGDLVFIKQLGLTISNPNTEKPVALGVDYVEESFGSRVKKWFEEDNDDDSDFFFTPSRSSTPLFGGGSFGGFGGGFGGFGGGGFGGGGASRGF